MEPMWFELLLTIEEPRDDSIICHMLVKRMQLLAVPPLGSQIAPYKYNELTVEVDRIVMLPYEKTDLHHTVALVYCELEKDSFNWYSADPAKVIKLLETDDYGWKTG